MVKEHIYFLIVLETGNPRSECQHGQVLVKALFLASCRVLIWSLLCAYVCRGGRRGRARQRERERRSEREKMREREWGRERNRQADMFFMSLIIRAIIPLWRPYPYDLIYPFLPPKGSVSTYHLMGGVVVAQYMNFGGHIQSIMMSKKCNLL